MRPPDSRAEEKLPRQIRRVREDMLTFMTNRTVTDTNNATERYLRPAAIFRKVTRAFAQTGAPTSTPAWAPWSTPVAYMA